MSDITAARPVAGAPVESAWGGQVHDQLEGIQAGAVNIVGNNSAPEYLVPVVFPRPYVTPPVVVVSGNSAITRALVVKVSSAAPGVTTTGFTIGCYHVSGTNWTGTIIGQWVAIGTPA